jgi:hypothetical protein
MNPGVTKVAAHSEPILFRIPEGADQRGTFGNKTEVASRHRVSRILTDRRGFHDSE